MRYDPVDKIILFGGSPTLVGMAKWLISQNINTLVYTSTRHANELLDAKDKLSDKLDKLGISYVITDDINSEGSLLSEISNSTLGIGIGEAWSFSESIINAFNGKLLDYMGIPLPRYRGGGHYTWMIMRDESSNGMRMQVINSDMVQGVFDSGEIVDTIDYEMSKDDQLPVDFFNREVEQSLIFLERFISDIHKGRDFKLETIDESKSLYLPRLSTIHHGWIDWQRWTGKDIEVFIKSFDNPYKGASTRYRGERVFLRGARILEVEKKFHPFQSGIIVRITKIEGVVIATTDGELAVSSVVDEFDNDVIINLNTGVRFLTPYEDIINALEFEASYAPSGLEENDSDILKPTILYGENLFLQTLEPKDSSEKYVNWLNDPEINRYLESRWVTQTIESTRQFIKDIADSDDSLLFGIFLKSDSSHVGNIKIGPIDKNHLCAEIGYIIGEKKAWGNGYATEAVGLITKFGFENLKLNKCIAGVYENNQASCRVLEKVGFSQEGISKKQLKVDDAWEDHIYYGILNENKL